MSLITPLSDSVLHAAARRALSLADSSPVCSPNPQVGCVILDDAGAVLASGVHLGPGSPHAEAAAISAARAAGIDLAGTTAVVTLEPCAKVGRTPPCAQALRDVGVGRVVYLHADPTSFGGGAQLLRGAGVEVFGPEDLDSVLVEELVLARRLLLPWATAELRRRPYVVAKFATTIDGRIAAADGSSQWITSAAAREHVHQVRAQVDAILVGTGTVLADDPSLTVRLGEDAGRAAMQQPESDLPASSSDLHPTERVQRPRRVVLGRRAIPADAKLRGPGGELVHLPTHDVCKALEELFNLGTRHLVVEGGAQVLGEFFAANFVDEIHHYQAPALLGAGRTVVNDFGITNISQARRFTRADLLDLSPDLLQVLIKPDQKYSSAVPQTWQTENLRKR